jgi:hypothetical protein
MFFWTPEMPHYYYPPFTGQGLEGISRELGEALRALWERLMDFLRSSPQSQRITF